MIAEVPSLRFEPPVNYFDACTWHMRMLGGVTRTTGTSQRPAGFAKQL
jgi:hypothetical protein